MRAAVECAPFVYCMSAAGQGLRGPFYEKKKCVEGQCRGANKDKHDRERERNWTSRSWVKKHAVWVSLWGFGCTLLCPSRLGRLWHLRLRRVPLDVPKGRRVMSQSPTSGGSAIASPQGTSVRATGSGVTSYKGEMERLHPSRHRYGRGSKGSPPSASDASASSAMP